ncbi:MAG: aspartate carbamoyltransferase [Armatimonadota bacterium]
MKRDLIAAADLSLEELTRLLDLAEEMESRGGRSVCEGQILATLFYEPSTRTRLSFEAAMLRLGGEVIGFADPRTSSLVKGETLADTARMVEQYADIIVIRHPLEGSAKVMADYAAKPVINAGDGGHEHPTQTLTDLYTLRRLRGGLEGLVVGLCGDLKYGRTVHSLAPVLAKLGAKLYCIAPPELTMPQEFLTEAEENGALLGQVTTLEEVIGELDALYMTRVQKERFERAEDYERVKGTYVVTKDSLDGAKQDMLILHPLPRVDEIAYEVDDDQRAAYFRQAGFGVPVRMALIAALLGRAGRAVLAPAEVAADRARQRPAAGEGAAARCGNARCVTQQESYLAPELVANVRAGARGGGTGDSTSWRCAYCEQTV